MKRFIKKVAKRLAHLIGPKLRLRIGNIMRKAERYFAKIDNRNIETSALPIPHMAYMNQSLDNFIDLQANFLRTQARKLSGIVVSDVTDVSSTLVSIVVSTYNRGANLELLLHSLQYLEHKNIQVIIVNGPSTDNTTEVIARSPVPVTYLNCPVVNISVSRNIGILASKGHIIAFIDDDGIPESNWVTELLSMYRDAETAAVGGWVLDNTGAEFQCKYINCDRNGDASFVDDVGKWAPSIPYASIFPTLIGVNSSFRKDYLIAVGGFDEEYEYFLDETDVCVRLIDAGLKIELAPNAIVHHHFAPSHLRDVKKRIKSLYPFVKNKVYFSSVNSKTHIHRSDALRYQAWIEKAIRSKDLRVLFDESALQDDDSEKHLNEIFHAINDGKLRSRLKRRFISASAKSPTLNEKTPHPDLHKHIVVVSRDYPPDLNGGIARFSEALAIELAGIGFVVHVFTLSNDAHNRVEYQSGIWIHRIVEVDRNKHRGVIEIADKLPDSIVRWAQAVSNELYRIQKHLQIYAVYAPIWDLEGILVKFENPQTKLITWLQTTYQITLANHPEWQANQYFWDNHYLPVVEGEKFLLEYSDGLHVISNGIRETIQTLYGRYPLLADTKKLPIGLRDLSSQGSPERRDSEELTVLFVGRLESRKGIDVLLKSIPKVLEEFPKTKFVIAGDDSLEVAELKMPGKLWFQNEYPKQLASVHFSGKVSDGQLNRFLESADIFIAPSRFESFGLVYIEAMMHGLPIIATNVGGIPEIVQDAVTGILVEVNSIEKTVVALKLLIANEELRVKLGAAARKKFLSEYEIGVVTKAIAKQFLSD